MKSQLLANAFVIGLLFLAGPSDSAWAQTTDVTVATEEVGDGVYVFRYGTHRSLFIIGNISVIVFDPLNEQAAQLYRKEITKLTDLPVSHVIYTHSHWDRIAGGQAFKNDRPMYIMQQDCAESLAEVAARTHLDRPEIVPPEYTFNDMIEVTSGTVAFNLYNFGPSHDKCLAIAHLRWIDALYMPELISTLGASLPVEDITLAHVELSNIVPFFKAVEDLAKHNDVETIIGGHARELMTDGELKLEPVTGPVALIEDQRQFWEDSLRYMEDLVDNGAQSSFLARLIDYERFEKYVGYDKGAVYKMLRRMITVFATG